MSKEETTESVPEVAKPTAASPTVWDPFERFGLPDFFSRWPSWFNAPWAERMMSDMPEIADIKVEHYMDESDLVVRGEIPGVDPEKDIDISVDGGRLTIRAKREHRIERDDEDYRTEFRYGSFSRVLTLPDGADADKISASYNDGILEVRVPIDEERSDRRRISVQRT